MGQVILAFVMAGFDNASTRQNLPEGSRVPGKNPLMIVSNLAVSRKNQPSRGQNQEGTIQAYRRFA
jgi:hypothetical protein